jgi:hypothetical protein
MTPVKSSAGHDYPFYKKQTTAMTDALTQKIMNGETPFHL